MDFETYQQLSRQTAIYPDVESNLHYPTLGLIDELAELAEAFDSNDLENIKKEMGDVFWYQSQLCTTLGLKLQDIYDEVKNKVDSCTWISGIQMWIYAAKIAGRVKKIERDYNNNPPEKIVSVIVDLLICINCSLYFTMLDRGFSVGEILEMNIDKLFDRKERNVLKGDGDNR